ncbi:ATP-binding protein [Paenibacillus hexagrammi]|uniref:histidine kinase n=1 Tax=Paenibacillus hexagrammi TaxID=2908839 RepID=A0ABY3SRW7_9BACL|nr:ATP-binding protein [Paenibacillus sp. YPD9-1]UJF36290.1 ATP-binding protein [Paenibacillus sp. YPD9-1]
MRGAAMYVTLSLKDLLLNMLIVITPTFVYQFYWTKNGGVESGKDGFIVGICSAVSLLLCMTFPIHMDGGFIYDLRFLPVILSFLYGGRWSGVFVTLLLFAYRYTLGGGGGSGFYLTLLINSLFSAMLYVMIPAFHRMSRNAKLRLIVWFSLGSSAFFLFILIVMRWKAHIPISHEFVFFGFLYLMVHPLTSWTMVYLIEELRETAKLRENIQRAEKLQVLSELSASVAHEIRNPMTTARGFMQLMKQEVKDNTKLHFYSSMIIDEIDRAQLIINDFLSFAKPQVEKMEYVEIEPQMKQAVDIMTPYALLKNVDIQMSPFENSPLVYVSKEKFTQCLVNILKNAVESIQTDEGLIQFSASINGDYTDIHIRDNGVGMTTEEVNRLGEPFYSTKEKGTGLGMMVCHRIIQSFQGNVAVSSEKGKGTLITITLPIHQAS